MNNIVSIIMKYGPVIAKYASYIKYLPLIAGLVEFVRTAQREFNQQGSGPQKAEWAEKKFIELVNMLEIWMWIKPAFANFLRTSASTLVKAIVEWYRDAQGEVPPAPPVDKPDELLGFPYGELLHAEPPRTDSRLKSGDALYKNPAADEWIVFGGFGREPKSWTLIWTVV